MLVHLDDARRLCVPSLFACLLVQFTQAEISFHLTATVPMPVERITPTRCDGVWLGADVSGFSVLGALACTKLTWRSQTCLTLARVVVLCICRIPWIFLGNVAIIQSHARSCCG
jgi:hypothetical protein